jgi:hypothetical protein
MSSLSHWQRVKNDVQAMLQVRPQIRPWQLSAVAALSVGLPVFIGALTGNIREAVLASMGGLVITYMPNASIVRRMITLIVALFGFVLSFSFVGLLSFNPILAAVGILAITILANGITRYWQVPAPGRFFFIMLAALAATLPFNLEALPVRVGWLMLGGTFTIIFAFLYSLSMPAKEPAAPLAVTVLYTRKQLLIESLVMGMVVAGSYVLALALGLTNPYWVPISCAAIMQGADLRIMRHRQIQRIVGTALGLVIAYLLLLLPLSGVQVAVAITLLVFIVEKSMVRHYGLAIIFITPLTILLADSALGTLALSELVQARFIDIALGSVIGFIGGYLAMITARRGAG